MLAEEAVVSKAAGASVSMEKGLGASCNINKNN